MTKALINRIVISRPHTDQLKKGTIVSVNTSGHSATKKHLISDDIALGIAFALVGIIATAAIDKLLSRAIAAIFSFAALVVLIMFDNRTQDFPLDIRLSVAVLISVAGLTATVAIYSKKHKNELVEHQIQRSLHKKDTEQRERIAFLEERVLTEQALRDKIQTYCDGFIVRRPSVSGYAIETPTGLRDEALRLAADLEGITNDVGEKIRSAKEDKDLILQGLKLRFEKDYHRRFTRYHDEMVRRMAKFPPAVYCPVTVQNAMNLNGQFTTYAMSEAVKYLRSLAEAFDSTVEN